MTKYKSLLRWIKLIVTSIAGLLIVAILAANLIQFLELRASNLQEPLGTMVRVGDHSLHIYCTGEGPITVILESGGGSWSLDWSPVQPEISKFAKVCSYDRAGFGWSDFGPEPRDLDRIVSELNLLLQNANIAPPYVMVGASKGGTIVQAFEHNHPELVSALVLVDGRPVEYRAIYKELAADIQAQTSLEQEIINGLFEFGFLSVSAYLLASFSVPDAIPLPLKQYYLNHGLRVKNVAALAKEMLAESDFDQQMKIIGTIGNKPLTVISRGKETLYPELSQTQANAMEEHWSDMQSELRSLSSKGKHVIATESGHVIQYDQPSLIVEEVRILILGD